MIIHCPNCETTHTTTDSQVGQRFQCSCRQWLMVARRVNGTHYAIRLPAPGEMRGGKPR